MSSLNSDLQDYQTVARESSHHSLAGYFSVAAIDANPNPGPYRLLKAPFQDELLHKLTLMIEQAAGLREYNPKLPRCAFVVLPKGHSKTSTLAQILNWALCYARREIRAYAAAADKSQANILLERMKSEADQNFWLRSKLHFINYEVKGTTGSLEVLSSDAPTSSGLLYDIAVIDEVTFHKKRDLFDILYAGRNKRNTACFIVLSNAGIQSTWQHNLWLQAQANPQTWVTFEVPAYSAPWLNRNAIEEDRSILPPSLFRRLHENVWVHPSDTGEYLSKEQVEACVDPDLCEQFHGSSQYEYVLGLDLGITNDPAVAAIVHRDDQGEIYLDRMQLWQGSTTERVPLAHVRAWVGSQIKSFRIQKIIVDNWQSEEMVQSWQDDYGVEVQRYSFQGQGHTKLAENLRSLVTQRRLHLPDTAGYNAADKHAPYLADEMANLIIEFQKDGKSYRFNHLAGHHDDRSCALALASIGIVQLPAPIIIHADDFVKLSRERLPAIQYSPVPKPPIPPATHSVAEEVMPDEPQEAEDFEMQALKYPDLEKYFPTRGYRATMFPGTSQKPPSFASQNQAQVSKHIFCELTGNHLPSYDKEKPELNAQESAVVERRIKEFIDTHRIPRKTEPQSQPQAALAGK